MPEANKTYCNPLPLPDYPRGILPGIGEVREYRDASDPSVILFRGKWYMFASGHLAYETEDFSEWRHVKVEPERIGFAPSAVYHGGAFLLTASAVASPHGLTELYISGSPTGPYKCMGAFRDMDGRELAVCDPMLFSDDDGELYLYYGGGNDGIYGVRLRRDDPTRFGCPPVNLIRYDPAHIWERGGDYHEDDRGSWLEGGWMYKRDGIYYLVYCAPGTEYSSYSLGAYRSREPLSGFVCQSNNPFLTNQNSGKLVRGCGHGCVVDAPDGAVWAFYTISVGQKHRLERMVGMDRLYIDGNGELASHGTTEIPQSVPGGGSIPALYPLTVRKNVFATSEIIGGEAVNATEENLFCRWMPAYDDARPVLTVELGREYRLFSVRIIFSDEGAEASIRRFFVEARHFESGRWEVIADRSDNVCDNIIEYLEFPEEKCFTADAVRLTMLREDGYSASFGVRNFTVFGTP